MTPMPVPRPRYLVALLALALLALVFLAVLPRLVSEATRENRLAKSQAVKATGARLKEAYGKLPLSFEANEGQTNPQVKFFSRNSGYSLFLTPSEAVFSLAKSSAQSDQEVLDSPANGVPDKLPASRNQNAATMQPPTTVLRMQLVGANKTAQVVGLDQLPGKTNYLIGSDAKKWRTGISTYAKVQYDEVYPGVDLVYYGNQRQLEYDFVVAPGADPEVIGIDFEGTEKLSIDDLGQLVLHVPDGELRLLKPVLYQEVGGQRREISGSYELENERQVGFQIGAYDPSRSLVIDPVLSYSTYLGTDSDDFGRGIAVDTAGNAYVTGSTGSASFPTAGTLQQFGGDVDIFVTKINAAGTAVLYSTFLGGGNAESGLGIAVDDAGNAFITGSTDSYNFPVSSSAFQAAKAGGDPYFKSTDSGASWGLRNGLTAAGIGSFAFHPTNPSIMFASTFNGAGIYKTTDGGDNWAPSNDGLTRQFVNNVVISSDPQILYAGVPATVGVFKSTDGGMSWFVPSNTGLTNVLVNTTVVDPFSPSTLYVGTFGGGVFKSTNGASSWTAVNTGLTDLDCLSLVVDPSNPLTLYVGTGNGVFKTVNAGTSWTLSHSFNTATSDYALAISPTNAAMVYSVSESALYRSTDAGGSWIQVLPASNNVSTVGIDPTTSSVVYAGTNNQGVLKSSDGGNHWSPTGLTSGYVHNVAVHPTIPARIYAGDFTGNDAFVAKLNDTGSALLYSTYLGGGDAGNNYLGSNDTGRAIAVDAGGNAYITGFTLGHDFPTRNPLQPNFGGVRDAFVAKLNPNASGIQSLIYSTYLGGSEFEDAFGMAVDSSGSCFVVGQTLSTNFPRQNALQNALAGSSDAFITKYDPTGSTHAYSTYLGGTGSELARAIALSAAGNAYVSGFTSSGTINVPNSSGAFPTVNSAQSARAGGNDAFVTNLSSTGSTLLYSTYLGGNGNDQGFGIAVDGSGSAYVTGLTNSGTVNVPNSIGAFPTLSALQTARSGGNDAFVTKLSSTGSSFLYSTYLGGSANDQGNGIALGGAGETYVVGQSFSTNFPTTPGAFSQFSFNFGTNISEAFVSKISESANSFSITGRLLTNAGVPIANGFVSVDDGTNFFNFTQSDSNGYYQFLSLLPGTYTVTPEPHSGSADGANSFFYTPPSRTFTNVSTDQIADFTGTPRFSIFSHVTDATNLTLGIRGVTMTLSGSSTATVVTACNGFYSFEDLVQGGNYTVTPSFGNATFNPPNLTFTNLSANQTQNFSTTSVSFFTVSGRVADANGNGVSGVTIVTSSIPQCFIQQPAQTDANGNYSISNLQEGGNYTFTAAKPGLTFTPQSPTLNNLSSNQTLNFTATPAIGLTGKIAFSAGPSQGQGQGFQPEIFTINADGTNQKNVTNNPASDEQPAWSPDGMRLVFNSERAGSFINDVYVMNADGTNVIRVTNDTLGKDRPTWSPDGARIAYASGECSNAGPQAIPNIFIINVDGSNRTQLTHESFTSFGPDWSPDGTKIAFAKGTSTDCSGGDADIYIIDPAGNNLTQLTLQGGNEYAAWSPDGTKLAFSREVFDSTTGFSENIYVMNADGSGQTQITSLPEAYNPTWSPDGTKIAFSAFLGTGSNQIFAINVDGTGLVQITNNQFGGSDPDWAPNSQGLTISGRVTDSSTQGISGATMTLSGSQSASVSTDTNGNYSFTRPTGGNYTLTPTKTGFSFTPANRTFDNLSANQTADFTGGTGNANDVTWINIQGGNWNAAANWRDGTGVNRVPTANDNVFIDLAGTYAVTLNVNATVNSLNLGGASGTQTFNTGGFTLTLDGASTVNTNGVLNLSGTVNGAGNLNVNGILNWTGGTMSGTGATSVAAGATLNIAGSQPFLSRTLNNSGTATFTSTSLLGFANGTFNNQASGIFEARVDTSLDGNNFGGTNAFNNAGTFRKSAGTGTTSVSAAFNNSGVVEVQTGVANFSGSYTQTAGATILNGGDLTKTGGTLSIQGGSLRGAGTITGNVSNAGTVRPGTSPGCLTITGNYTQTATGILDIEIGGLTACSQFDRLAVTGSATLAGTLNATLISGFNPGFNDSFQVMTFASPSGTFASVNGPFDANYSNTDVVLGSNAPPPTTFTVTNTNNGGAGSLQQAILDANANAGTQTIAFNIPGSGVHTITPAPALPSITDAVVLDGYTQPGAQTNTQAVGSNAVLLIELSGAAAGQGAIGLNIMGGGGIVRGLVINRFSNQGLRLQTGGGNTIEGNRIGTDPTGTIAQGNNFGAINILNSSTNLIGGSAPAARNLILGGITIFGFSGDGKPTDTSGNTVQGNYIGTDVTGQNALGNTLNGIRLDDGSGEPNNTAVNTVTNNRIGGLAAGAGNVIAFNGGNGVFLNGPNTLRNSLLSNFIFANNDLGIRLQNGANNNQSAPVLTSAVSSGGNTMIQGTLISTANTSFNVQFFSNDFCDSAGAGEGQTLIASTTVTTDGSGNANFTITPQSAVAMGQFITATVTDPANNTSGFSQCRQVAGQTFTISGRVTDSATNAGIDGVTISLSGSQSGTTTTDLSGSYSFANLAAGGNYTVTPSKTNFTFQPPNQTFNNLSSNQTGDSVGTEEISVTTPAGSNVTVEIEEGLTLSFANVSTAGTTTVKRINAGTAGPLPTGYSVFDIEAIDITTTATVSGPITLCGVIDEVDDSAVFSSLRILHGENGVLVDRTSSSDFATRTICATVNNLSPFVLALVQLQTISGHVDSGDVSLAGVTMTLSGTQSGTTTTDSNGNYSFIVLSGGSYTVTPSRTSFNFSPPSLSFPSLSGNVINANFTGSLDNFTISGRVADASGNGIDGVALTLAGVGARTITTDSNGNYSFPQVAANSNYILTPTKFGITFTPSSQTFTNLNSTQEEIDFTGTLVPNPTPTPTPSEDFNDGTTGPNFTPGTLTTTPASNNPNVTVTVANGQLVITPLSGANGSNFNGIVLVSPIDLTLTPTVSIEVVQVQDEGTTSFALGNDPNNWYRFAAGTDETLEPSGAKTSTNVKRTATGASTEAVKMLFFQTNLGGTKFSTSITYDPVAHRFWRFRFETPVINFETSPDAQVWTLRFSSAISKPVTGLVAEIAAGTTGPALQPGKAIFDNFAASAEALPVNRIDQADFFVRQQYLDFLNREPDAGGLAYWLIEIQRCGNNASCIQSQRLGVSAAFFVENEFQQTGSFVYLLYQAAFNRRLTRAEFQSDRSRLVVGPNLDATKQALADDFVTRPAFKTTYDQLSSVDYVDALFANAGIAPTQEERAALVIGLLTGQLTRGDVLFRIAENQAFKHKEFNSAFVLMQYFGYLGRDPDGGGFLFWLDVLNNRQPNNHVGMVCAFITSREYQLRFGSIVTRSDADCAQQ